MPGVHVAIVELWWGHCSTQLSIKVKFKPHITDNMHQLTILGSLLEYKNIKPNNHSIIIIFFESV